MEYYKKQESTGKISALWTDKLKRSAELRYNYHVNIVCTNKINWAFTLIKTFWPPWYIKPSLSIFHVFRMSLGGGPVALFLFPLFVWVPKNALWIIQIVALIFPSVFVVTKNQQGQLVLSKLKRSRPGQRGLKWEVTVPVLSGRKTYRMWPTNTNTWVGVKECACARARVCMCVTESESEMKTETPAVLKDLFFFCWTHVSCFCFSVVLRPEAGLSCEATSRGLPVLAQ